MVDNAMRAVYNRDKPRRCTDSLFLLLFLASLGALVYVCGFGVSHGNIKRVVHGMDYMSDVCGQDNSHGQRLVNATFNRPTLWDYLFGFGVLPKEYTKTVLRGGRDLTDRPYLYYSFPTGSIDQWESTAICVSECPSMPSNTTTAADYAEDPSKWICTGKYLKGPPANCPDGLGDEPECKAYRQGYFTRADPKEAKRCNDLQDDCDICYPPYGTIQMLSYCLPDPHHALDTFQTVVVALGSIGVAVGNAIEGPTLGEERNDTGVRLIENSDSLSLDDLQDMREFVSSYPHLFYEDLRVALPVVIGCTAVSFVLAWVWMGLLRFFAGWMVWLTVVGGAAGLAIGSWFLFYTYSWMSETLEYGVDELYTRDTNIIYYCFFGAVGLTLLYLVLVFCLRKKIIVATRVMQEATRAVGSLPFMFLLPVIMIALLAGAIVYGATVALLVLSTGELQLGNTGFGHFHLDVERGGYLFLHMFVTCWAIFWLRHLQHCTVAGAVAQWYFANNKRSGVGSFATLGALCRVLRYHAGTVAMGSLIITMLKAVRFIVLLLTRRTASCTGNGKLTKLCCCCLQCCLKCVENCVKYISRNAYIQMMISGDPFCKSAFSAVSMLTQNLVKVAVVRSIGSGFLLLGKVFIAGGCGAMGALILLTQSPYKDELYSLFPPVAAIVVFSYLIALSFMGIYNVTIDAIFGCFCCDQERAKAGLPTFCSDSLASLIRNPEGLSQGLLKNEQPPSKKLRGHNGLPAEAVPTGVPLSADAVVLEEQRTSTRSGRSSKKLSQANSNPWGP